MIKKIIIATHNPGKLAEFQAILNPVECISLQELDIAGVEETGLSFIENALLKARYVSSLTHQPALGDDSGLVVDALEGAPGIYSARFAGPQASAEDNMILLLEKLAYVAVKQRHAYFYCALALVKHPLDPTPIIALGKVEGQIHHAPQGKQGFGYDPLFYLPEEGCTMAELSPQRKNEISHRARALKQLQVLLT